MASFLGKVFVAFQANDSSHTLWIAQSTDGTTFTYPGTQFLNVRIGSAPALAVLNGSLFVIFEANDGSQDLEFMSTTDGINFSPVTNTGIQISGAVYAATAFDRIYVPFQTPSSKVLAYTTVLGPNNFTTPVYFTTINNNGPSITGGSPAVGFFNNVVYFAFQSNDPSHTLWIGHTNDGFNFTNPVPYSGIRMGSTPSMVTFNNALYLAFKANDSSNTLWVVSSTDGVNFTNPGTQYTAIKMNGSTGPATTVANLPGQTLNGHLILSLESNSPNHDLFTLNTP